LAANFDKLINKTPKLTGFKGKTALFTLVKASKRIFRVKPAENDVQLKLKLLILPKNNLCRPNSKSLINFDLGKRTYRLLREKPSSVLQ